jgi:hypothetical protein
MQLGRARPVVGIGRHGRRQRRAARHGLDHGALWTSDDGGEHWQLVNAHLPPIYAVRFI